MMIKLIKLPFKVLTVLLLLLGTTLSILFKMVANLSCYLVGPFMLFLLGCCICSVVKQMWGALFILVLSEVACVALVFCAALVEAGLDRVNEAFVDFLHS